MRVVTPQIIWHNRDPVLCVDFDPSCFPNTDSGNKEDGGNKRNDFYRLATGGSDTHLLIWHLRDSNSSKPSLICAADLTRHNKSVNTLRFSPCGQFLASADDDAYVYILKRGTENPEKSQERSPDGVDENWIVDKVLRKHIDDITDLSWSPDSAYLVTTSVDNCAVIWDMKKGLQMYNWSDHVGFVQGVSFDPLQEFVATVSTDRTLRLFNPQTGKLMQKTLKYPSKWLPKEKEIPAPEVVASAGDEEETESASSKKVLPGPCNRLFHDDTLKSFCRRLTFSPKGEFLVVPGGILPPNRRDESESPPAKQDLNGNPTTDTPTTKKSKKSSAVAVNKEKPLFDKNAVIIFCRNSFSNPCSVIPTGTSYSIAARFCPLYFQRNRDVIVYDKGIMNPAKKSERLITCTGKLKQPKKGKKAPLEMPYRLVFAVGTNDSLIISDTDSATPLAVVRNIHHTRVTDLSWSPDGRILIASSTDGYCSIISFEQEELGLSILGEIPPVPAEAYPIPAPPPAKEKPIKKPKKRPPKEVAEKELKESRKSDKVKLPTPSSAKKKEGKKTLKKGKEIAKYLPPTERSLAPAVAEASMKLDVDVDDAAKPSELAAGGKSPRETKDVILVDLEEESLQNGSYEETEAEKEKIPITPKRNTFLDRWLKKIPTSSDGPVKETEDKTEVLSSVPPPPPFASPLKPIDAGMNFPISGSMTTPLPSPGSARPNITPDKIRQLENAPIIVDLEADEAENAASVILSSADLAKDDKEIEKTEITLIKPPLPKVPAPPTMTPNTSAREKRPASSPLSSQQKPKQPRRVEFITLPKSPRRD